MLEKFIKHKTCNCCEKTYEVSNVYFYRHKYHKDGFENICKWCRGAKRPPVLSNQKYCNGCKQVLNTSEFYIQNKATGSFYSRCKKCILSYRNTPKNSKYKKEYNKEYFKKRYHTDSEFKQRIHKHAKKFLDKATKEISDAYVKVLFRSGTPKYISIPKDFSIPVEIAELKRANLELKRTIRNRR